MQKPIVPHTMKKGEIYQTFSTSHLGLSVLTAAQRLKTYGENVLEEGHKKTIVSIMLGQFKNLMIIVLLAAALISVFLGQVSDSAIIFAVVLLNAIMGTVQESKAEAALVALKRCLHRMSM